MSTRRLTTADQLRAEIAADAEMVSRYAVRFVLVEGLTAWQDALAVLGEIAQGVVRLSSVASDDDLPTLQSVIDAVADPSVSTMLLPLGEILRLAPGMAHSYVSWLTRIPALDGKLRLYVPLLAVSGLFLPILEDMSQYLNYSPPAWCFDGSDTATDTANVKVVSNAYHCLNGRRIHGFKEYLRLWEGGGTAESLLITRGPELFNGSHGAVNLEILPTAFDVVQVCSTDVSVLDRRWGRDAQWRWLAEQLAPGEGISSGALRLLGLARFLPKQLWALWPHFGAEMRWLAWLLAKTSITGEGPTVDAVRASGSPEQFVESAANSVFDQDDRSIPWLEERRNLLSLLLDGPLPDSFWRQLESTPDPLSRLASLPGLSDREREVAVEAVGRLVKTGAPQTKWLPLLQVAYPELFTYLTTASQYPWLDEYFQAYRLSRLADSPTPQLLDKAVEWARCGMLWDYPTRAQALEQQGVLPDEAVWVDGMGLEWVGLLWHKLESRGLHVDVKVSRANLPTITANNHDWTAAHVIRGMDGYAHSHEYSYPHAIVRQMSVISSVVDVVQARLLESPLVVITSDHGMTRFAATGDRLEVPDGYAAHGWGRHAWAAEPGHAPENEEGMWVEEGAYLALARHALFRGGSASSGEVHGGATPEECLVPVLRVSQRGRGKPTVVSVSAPVRLDVRNRGLLHVVLSEPCKALYMQLAGRNIVGRRSQDAGWDLELTELLPGTHTGQLVYDEGLVGSITFECIRGMIENYLFL
ncbi:MAG: BREX-4 system phosphatase PglZ [Anaerolineae bacterium]